MRTMDQRLPTAGGLYRPCAPMAAVPDRGFRDDPGPHRPALLRCRRRCPSDHSPVRAHRGGRIGDGARILSENEQQAFAAAAFEIRWAKAESVQHLTRQDAGGPTARRRLPTLWHTLNGASYVERHITAVMWRRQLCGGRSCSTASSGLAEVTFT